MQQNISNPDAKAFETVPFGSPVAEVMAIVRRDGGVILEGALTPEQVAQVNADVGPDLEKHHSGSTSADEWNQEFHGALTKRLTNVVTLSKTYREAILSSPVTLGYIKELFKGVSDTLWLNGSQVIEILPGEDAQMLHRDMENYPIFLQYGPTGPEVMANLIVALMDVTDECGATRYIPGSHTWEFDRPVDQGMTLPAVMKAGSALFYGGKLSHGGGANQTADVKRRVITSTYNPGFLVPEEAYPFIVPIEAAREMSPVMQQLIGFRSFHQREPQGGSLWQHNYEELADHLGL